MRFVWRLLLFVFLLLPSMARAETADETERARARYEAGRALYASGRYDDAIREFNAGYEIAPKPRFLYNLALCYRKLGELAKARDHLRRYLSQAPENDPNRHSIEGQLADIEAELGIQSGRAAAAPAAPARPVESAPAPAAASSEPSANALVAAPQPQGSSAKRHLAWAIPVSVVVVGVAVGLGAYFGTRTSCGASVGCIDAGR